MTENTQKIEDAIEELRKLKKMDGVDIKNLIALAQDSQQRIKNTRQILSGLKKVA